MLKIPLNLTHFPAKAGWLGGLGLFLLCAAIALTTTLSLPIREENAALMNENLRLESLLRRTSRASSLPRVDQQLGAFIASLPKAGDINEILNLLHELMAKHRLSLKNSEYKTDQNKTGKFMRLRIAAKMESNYPDLVEFLREARQALPTLAVDQISLARQKISDTKLDTVIGFTLYYSQAEK